MKRVLAIFCCIVMMMCLLTGCGGGSGSKSYDNGFTAGDSIGSIESAPMDLSGQPAEKKQVYNGSMRLETVKYEEALSWIKDQIAAVNGYIESESEYTTDSGLDQRQFRNDTMTLRIPADQFQTFVDTLKSSDLLSVQSSDVSAEDVTEQYYDVEARRNALQAQVDRLQELMAQATDVSEVLAVESELANAIAELDSLQGRLDRYDSVIEMSYLEISLREVTALTMTAKAANYGSKLTEGFVYGFVSGLEFLGDLLLVIVSNWLLLVVAVIIVVLVERKSRKRRLARKEAKLAGQEKLKRQQQTLDEIHAMLKDDAPEAPEHDVNENS